MLNILAKSPCSATSMPSPELMPWKWKLVMRYDQQLSVQDGIAPSRGRITILCNNAPSENHSLDNSLKTATSVKGACNFSFTHWRTFSSCYLQIMKVRVLQESSSARPGEQCGTTAVATTVVVSAVIQHCDTVIHSNKNLYKFQNTVQCYKKYEKTQSIS